MSYRICVSNISKIESYEKYADSNKIKLIGNGVFLTPFNKIEGSLDKTGVSTAKVIFHSELDIKKLKIDKNKQEAWHLQIVSWRDYDDKIEEISIYVICEKTLYEKLDKFAANENQIEISFDIIEHDSNDNADSYKPYETFIAKIEDFKISTEKNSKKLDFKDFEIVDIKNYLIERNCFGGFGQIKDICEEFSKSFHQMPSRVDKNEMIWKIESFISSLRSIFHNHLDNYNELKIKSFSEKYQYELSNNNELSKINLNKITDEKDRNEAIKIYNNIWSRRKAEDIFRKGFPIDANTAESIAKEYIDLKYVQSTTCEKILLDVLISSSIAEYAMVGQINNKISAEALLSIEYDSYKPKLGFKISFTEFIFISLSSLTGRIFSGLISWWISGLIAGDNETAHIILFGTMFAADTVLLGMYQNNEFKRDKESSYFDEKRHFDILKNMCNLHYYSSVIDTTLMRYMLNQLSSSGVRFQNQIFQIISLIETRK
jgi:hypothetical protein